MKLAAFRVITREDTNDFKHLKKKNPCNARPPGYRINWIYCFVANRTCTWETLQILLAQMAQIIKVKRVILEVVMLKNKIIQHFTDNSPTMHHTMVRFQSQLLFLEIWERLKKDFDFVCYMTPLNPAHWTFKRVQVIMLIPTDLSWNE